MSWPNQKYVNYPFVKFTNLKGENGTSADSISIGLDAGNQDQGEGCIAIGNSSGTFKQADNTIAIGVNAGQGSQSLNSIAIGVNAGQETQGEYSIAIGYSAGTSTQSDGNLISQHANTIILNAIDAELNSTNTNSTYINPIRQAPNNDMLMYNGKTCEITTQPLKVMLDTYYLPAPISNGTGWTPYYATGTSSPGININTSSYSSNCLKGTSSPTQSYTLFIGLWDHTTTPISAKGDAYQVLTNTYTCQPITISPLKYYPSSSTISAWAKIKIGPNVLDQTFTPIHLKVYLKDDNNCITHFDWSMSFEYAVMMSKANVFNINNWNFDTSSALDPDEFYIPLLIPANHTISYNWCAPPYPPS